MRYIFTKEVGDLRDLKKENREKACFAVMWMQRS
jgi:hypothetical protein